LPPLHLPQPHRPILTATEQVAAVGGEGQPIHRSSMSLQHRRGTPCFPMPQPDRVVKAATGHGASIWTPGQALHLLGMARKLLAQTASFSQLPELDAAIPTPAHQAAAARSKA